MEHCPKVCDADEWQDEEGKWHFDQFETPMSPEADADEQLLVALYKSVAGKSVDIRIDVDFFIADIFTVNDYFSVNCCSIVFIFM